ncbi:hypothetical protein [Clostridium sp. HBUAS56010]|uniref:hypothetical protein n=1 Tax=Clostridium sp. HBUAS56010 TaxID=2571127 RepID=UPI001178A1B4|nr:hypothetical protein [Clostridium sp. HBUAS56010]
MNANELLESKELREKLVAKVEILEKVKKLLLIPGTESATINEVAEYYEVSVDVIKKVYQRHTNEINEDGIKILSAKELIGQNCPISQNVSKTQFKTLIKYEDGQVVDIPNRGIKVFPRRAILRIGMLLSGSKVAERIRTSLLDIEESAPKEMKVEAIETEKEIINAVGAAIMSGDVEALAMATTKMMDYKNRHITKLEESKKALANGILEWEDRSRINFAVRKMAAYARIPVGKAFNELYKQLKNKYHIDLPSRGKQPWIQHVNEKEWQCVVKAFSALCEYYELEPSEMFHDLKIEEETEV